MYVGQVDNLSHHRNPYTRLKIDLIHALLPLTCNLSPVTYHLFMPKRHHRIYPRRTSCRQVTGEQRGES
jgi:hypothetical protein